MRGRVMQCPVTVEFFGPKECDVCDGRGWIRGESLGDGRFARTPCEECDGIGAREYVDEEHPLDCDVCSGTGELTADVSSWVSEFMLASLSESDQRAILKLHEWGLLVRPPVAVEYGLMEFCVAHGHDADELCKRAGLSSAMVLNRVALALDPRTQPGQWVAIKVTPPSISELRRVASACCSATAH